MKYVYLVIAFLICGMFLKSGYDGYMIYKVKAERQELINKNVANTARTWGSLQRVRTAWDKKFKPADGVADLYTVFQMIDLRNSTRLSYDTSSLVDGGRESVMYEGMEIGLAKACVKTSARGVVATSTSLGAMLNDIKRLEQRDDITFSTIQIVDDNGVKTIIFDQLCVLLRGRDEF